MREQLFHLLAEAAEVEHNLLCCYLYAVFSLKRDVDEGLTQEESAAVAGWRGVIMSVAVEEMAHLALVANLTVAVGGRPHFNRSNLPVAAGYYPADFVVLLAPFDWTPSRILSNWSARRASRCLTGKGSRSP